MVVVFIVIIVQKEPLQQDHICTKQNVKK